MLLKDLGSIGIVKDLDPHEIPPNAFSDGMNVRFTPRGVEQVYGYGEILSPPSLTTPRWLKPYPPITSPLWLYGDQTRMFCLDGISHSEVTRASGNYSGSEFDRWQATLLSGVPILNIPSDVPQAWPFIAASSKLIDLPYWPVNWRCGFIRAFKSLLIAGNLTISGISYPYRITWSHPAEPGTVPTAWDPSDPAVDTGARDLGETTDEVVDGLDLGDLFIVYREESTYAFQYVGAPNFFLSYRLLDDGAGILWRDCVAKIPLGHIVLTRNDLIVHNGGRNSAQSLIDRRWKKWLFSSLDDTNFKNSFLMVNFPEKEVWVCVPETGNEFATLALIWNWSSGGIGIQELPGVPFIASGLKTDIVTGDNWG